MSHTFLLVSGNSETRWSLILQKALSLLGELHTTSEEETIQAVLRCDYDVVVIDAGVVFDAPLLVSHLRMQRPEARVVVATASPTWQRAREVLKAGAADYIRKSLDERELRSQVEAVLKLPSPTRPNRKEGVNT